MRSHQKLLIGSSLYALSIALAPRAFADCASGNGVITATGLCASPQNLVTANGTVVSGATLSTGSNTAYTIGGTNAALTNSGIIESENEFVTLEMNGSGGTLINSGTISGGITNDNSGDAVHIDGTQAEIINHGLIFAGAGSGISGETGFTELGGTLTGNFTNTGSIIAVGAFQGAGVEIFRIDGSFYNSGLIVVENPNENLPPNGVNMGTLAGAFLNDKTGTISGFNGVGGNFFDGFTNKGDIEGVYGTGLGAVFSGGTFNNSGRIYGAEFGMDVGGSGNIVNTGTIAGGVAMVFGGANGNYTGNIINSGLISGSQYSEIGGAIETGGLVIGDIINTGTIEANAFNAISIPGSGNGTTGLDGKLVNSGVIDAVNGAAANLGGPDFGGVTNQASGVIEGYAGIQITSPSRVTITNAGMINVEGVAVILNYQGNGMELDNTGTIIGSINPEYTVAPSVINQNGGAIDGLIDLQAYGNEGGVYNQSGDILNVNGGTISGQIGDQYLGGTVNFNLHNTTPYVINDPIMVDTANFNTGTYVLNNTITTADNYATGNAVFNNGATLLTAPLGTQQSGVINGNFTQGAGGTLEVEVYPSGANTLRVAGNAQIGGTAAIYYDPGTYESTTDQLVSAGNTLSGTFSKLTTANGVPAGISPALGYTNNSANLILTAGVSPPPPPVSPPPPPPPPPVSPPPPPPPPPVSPPPPPPPPPVSPPPPPPPPVSPPPPPPPPPVSPPPPPPPPPVSPPPPPPPPPVSPPPPPPPPPVSPPPPPVVVAPQHATIFPEIATVAIFDADQAVTALLDRGLNPQSPGDTPQFAFNDVSNPLGGQSQGGAAELGAAVPEVLAAYGAWIDATGNFANVYNGDGAPGYQAQTGGFLAGINRPVTPDLSLGVAVGYEHFTLNENRTDAQGNVDTGRFAFYGAYQLGTAILSATAGFGYDAVSTTRPLPVGTAKENHGGLEANGGLQLSQPMQFDAYALVPKIGLEYVNLNEQDFTESGAGGADLSNDGHSNASLQPFVGFNLSRVFTTDAGTKLVPQVSAQYNVEALNPRRRETVISHDGTQFPINGVTAPHNIVTGGFALSATTVNNLDIYAGYNISIGAGVSTVQVVSAGLSYKF